MINDSVIFAENFRTRFAALPSWALPVDQPGLGGQPSMPLRSERTFVRVAVLLELSPTTASPKRPMNKTPQLPSQPSTTVRSANLRMTSQPQTYSVFSFTRSPNPANPRSPRWRCATNHTYSLVKAGSLPPIAHSCTRDPPTPSTTNPTPWRRHTTGRLWQATSSRTTVRESLEFSTPPTRTHFILSSSTSAPLFGTTSTGGRLMEANYS